MNRIDISKFKFNFEKKNVLPLFISLLFSTMILVFSNHFSSENASRNLIFQILFFIAVLTVNFLTIDQQLNKFNLTFVTPLLICPILILVIFLFTKLRLTSLVGLLTLVPFATNILPFKQKNGVGLISFSVATGFIEPLLFFYIRNGFVTNIFLQICILLSLAFILIFFAIYVKPSSNFNIFALVMLAITTLYSIFIFKSFTILVIPIIIVGSWFIQKMEMRPKLVRFILFLLACLLLIFTITK